MTSTVAAGVDDSVAAAGIPFFAGIVFGAGGVTFEADADCAATQQSPVFFSSSRTCGY